MLRLPCFALPLVAVVIGAAPSYGADNVIDSIPAGYTLQAYDDCGMPGRQPHIDMADCYNFTFALSDTDADLKSRSAVFSYKEIRINYEDLDPKQSYVLALTYASDHTYKRVQSLWAGEVELHAPMPLPNAKAVKVLVSVPASAVGDGKLSLTIKIHGEVNATVSVAELWSTGSSKETPRFGPVAAVPGGVAGRLEGMTFEGLEGVPVEARIARSGQVLAAVTTGENGRFAFDSKLWRKTVNDDVRIVANVGEQETSKTLAASQLGFEPIRYRPIPVTVDGLKSHELSLDGTWRINPAPAEDIREQPLTAKGWSDFHAPGQWVQQGFDIPQDEPVALAREFTIPKQWAGYRLFLRFDAIHAGTDYWLNGKKLGHSENLFTPIEWEITDAARAGQTNRLDLNMVVSTASERLSCSSSYAQHGLGGIDRAVRVYALPKLQISTLHLNAGLDTAYRDGELNVDLGIDGPGSAATAGVEAVLRLYDAKGKPVEHSTHRAALSPESNTLSIRSKVASPLKWNAEQPNIYKLVIELVRDGKMLERIERNIGFRKVEMRDKQLYVNGVRIKLAGVCRHEIDPLTGRADTMRHAEDDIKLFKSANLNLVRTSHYPPTQEFLDAADRYGMYIESEAPFCWVAPAEDLSDLQAILTPTSAMIDYNHPHPSVIIWSIANESHWSDLFDYSNQLCKQLDPSRPTTINHAFSGEEKVTCDIINRHYQNMPYDEVLKDDPRPFLHGECFFLVYHERTDVAIDPGLRELWAHGSADPSSEWGKYCAETFSKPSLHAGVHPGAWSHIYDSKRVVGSEIWSGVDDISYLPDGKAMSSENANAYWGLVDGWRRAKPELWLSRALFSPVWFPERQVHYKQGQASVRIPVQNRYSFTGLDKLDFAWILNGAKGKASVDVLPACKGEIQIPIPAGTPEGSALRISVAKGESSVIEATILLGEKKPAALPQPQAGAPKWSEDDKSITVDGKGFGFVLSRATGDFDAASTGPVTHFPTLHVTRHDYGDLAALAGVKSPPYAVFPDAKSRVIDSVSATERDGGLEITVKDHYDQFAGQVSWLIDKNGVGRLSYDYTYSGEDLDSREIGLVLSLRPDYDEITWKRWSEWGDAFPEDSISRTQGSAKARRDKRWPDAPANVKPSWPWKLDQTELGTNDFRSAKFSIYEAALTSSDGSAVRANANADAHVRACLAENGVRMHLLKQCPLGQVVIKSGDRLRGEFVVSLVPAKP